MTTPSASLYPLPMKALRLRRALALPRRRPRASLVLLLAGVAVILVWPDAWLSPIGMAFLTGSALPFGLSTLTRLEQQLEELDETARHRREAGRTVDPA